MPKEAIGYLTQDGKFFEVEEDAEEHEAWISLKAALDEVGSIDIDAFMMIVATIPKEVRRYINANEAANSARAVQDADRKEDQARREGVVKTVLEQPPSLGEPLPDLGSSQQQKALQLERKINGPGSRGVDASDVRGSEDMAVGTHSAAAEARTVHRSQNIRKATMDEMSERVCIFSSEGK